MPLIHSLRFKHSGDRPRSSFDWVFALIGVGICMIALNTFAGDVHANDLSAYWKLEETSGAAIFTDAYGNSDGQCATSPLIVNPNCPSQAPDGKIGAAQRFDQATPSGIDILALPTEDRPFDWERYDSFTIEFWMRYKDDTLIGSDNEVIVGRDDSQGSTNLHWWFGVESPTGQSPFPIGVSKRWVGFRFPDGWSPCR